MSFVSPEFAIQLIVSLFGAGGLTVLVSGWRDKRRADAVAGKEDASAADIIQGTAGRQVKWFEDQLVAVRLELTEEKRLRRETDQVNRAIIDQWRSHEEWDRQAVAELARHGITLSDPPRLVLPTS